MVKTLSLEQLREIMLDSTEARQAYEDFDKELALTEKLYAMREHAGLSQRALAARLGVSPSAINRLEKSPASASLKTLDRYAKACGAILNVDVRFLAA
jgi:DNA-binding XRE family transcriptional regulator